MIEWSERYNCHTAQIAKGALRLSVNWSMNRERQGYDVCVNDRRLVEPIKDITEAKAAAVRLAKKIANEIVEELKDV